MNTNTQSTVKTVPAFRQNRFTAAKMELKGDLQRLFAIEETTAFVITEVVVDQYLKIEQAEKSTATLNVGKERKGEMTVKSLFKAKVATTPALKIARACAWCNEAKENGINSGQTEWSLSPELNVYVNDVRKEIADGKHDTRFSQ